MPRIWSQILYDIVYCKHVYVQLYLFKEVCYFANVDYVYLFSVHSTELHVLIIITFSYLKFVLFCINCLLL